MNNKQRQISLFLATLGSVLMMVCAGLYFFTRKKDELTKEDIIATILITVCSVIVLTTALICCLRGWHREPYQKTIRRNSSYRQVAVLMGSDCGICIEPKDSNISKVVKLTCDHAFHKECILKSLEAQPKCPICRQTPSKFSSIERMLYTLYGTIIQSLRRSKRNEIVTSSAETPV